MIAREVTYSRHVMFLGYDIDRSELARGESFNITYYWKCLRRIRKNLAIFVHIFQGNQKFQQDHFPQKGKYSTYQWEKGEVIKETYVVEIPNDIPTGNYTIGIGLWDPYKSKKRLIIAETDVSCKENIAFIGNIEVLP